MNQIVFRTQIPNQRSAPVISSWYPGQNAVTPLDVLEESSEIANVLAGRQEGSRTLKDNDLCLKNLSYLFGALPCQPDLLSSTKASIEILFCGAQRGFEPAIRRACRRVRYQLPRLHAESKFRGCLRSPSPGRSDGWRLVKRCLKLYRCEIADVTRLGFGPAAAADKERSFFHSEKRTR